MIDRLCRAVALTRMKGGVRARLKGIHYDHFKIAYTLKQRGIRPSVVLDIGASTGQFARAILSVFPDAIVHAFEPLDSCVSELQRVAKQNARIIVHPVALGDEEKRTTMFKNRYHYSSSLLRMLDLHKEAFPETNNVEATYVDLKPLDSFLPCIGTVGPMLAKIDVQGYEDKVISGGRKLLQACDYLIIELSFKRLYENQPLFEELQAQLLTLGFHFAGQLGEMQHPVTGEVLQIDGLFLKT